jgi:hypothetical protein
MEETNKTQSVEEALLNFLEQEKPIILNWQDKVNANYPYMIEVDQLQGYTTFQATFSNISDMDYRILEECVKGEQILFVFHGQHFAFEMGIDPQKLMADHGKIRLFELPLKDKPEILRFIKLDN